MFCLSCLGGECHIYQCYMIRGTSQILGSSVFSATVVTLNTNTCSVLHSSSPCLKTSAMFSKVRYLTGTLSILIRAGLLWQLGWNSHRFMGYQGN